MLLLVVIGARRDIEFRMYCTLGVFCCCLRLLIAAAGTNSSHIVSPAADPPTCCCNYAGMWLGIVATISQFRPVIGDISLALLGPYLLWVSYATALTLWIWRHNPQQVQSMVVCLAAYLSDCSLLLQAPVRQLCRTTVR